MASLCYLCYPFLNETLIPAIIKFPPDKHPDWVIERRLCHPEFILLECLSDTHTRQSSEKDIMFEQSPPGIHLVSAAQPPQNVWHPVHCLVVLGNLCYTDH